MGKMLFQSGLISRSDIVETSGLNLTGEHVGTTKKVVQDLLDKAKGGILFIDEAYELGQGAYGSEACSTLVEAMTNEHKYGGLVIIVAGYQADMQSMLDTNQGLKSRFNRFINFPDWEIQDCVNYFSDLVDGKNLSLHNKEFSFSLLHKRFSKLKPLKGWGNARDVVKIFENALENRAMRLSESSRDKDDNSTEKVLLESDINSALQSVVDARMGSSSSAIKRGHASDVDPFADLNKLYRMETVRAKLQQLRNTYLMAQNDGEDPPPLGHFIFTGSPGTGKTTVARVMSKILFDLDLSSRNHVEETSGLNMQGQYVGQTKDVVESLLDKAKGGVLFIDEAYTLGQGSFGSEACDSLVAAMTNPEYAGVVVVIAGYPKDIDDMLQSNAGLKSRFTHTITFPDWNPNDCVDYYCKKAQSNGFVLRGNAVSILQSGFQKIKELDGFGNARDVDAIWNAATRHRADRIVQMGMPRSKEKCFEETDISEALSELIKGRTAALTGPCASLQ
jgi:SpoVK/Ycf46/Vps4 family AAA+-type ATPase